MRRFTQLAISGLIVACSLWVVLHLNVLAEPPDLDPNVDSPFREVTGTISGTVLGADTGQPLQNIAIRVYTLTQYLEQAYVASGFAGDDGHYQIRGLSPGDYYLFFDPPHDLNYLDQYYDGAGRIDEAQPISVTYGSQVTITPTLAVGSVVSGTVITADTGQPLRNVRISVYTRTHTYQWVSVKSVSSNDNGQFQIVGLPTGPYYLFANVSDNSLYLDEYYDDVYTQAEATPVSLQVGNPFLFSPVLNVGAVITGEITAADTGLGLANVYVQLKEYICDAPVSVASAWTDEQGVYTLVQIAGGDYEIEVDPDRSDLSPGQAYIGRSQSVNGVAVGERRQLDFSLDRGGQITGTIVAADSNAPLSGVWVAVYAYDAEADHYRFLHRVPTNSAGVYTTNGLATGDYFLHIDPNFLSAPSSGPRFGSNDSTQPYLAAWYDNADSPDAAQSISVTQGQLTPNIDISLTRGGQIAGRVLAADGNEPLESITVIIFDGNENRLAGASTDANGNYRTPGLPAGTYYLLFVPGSSFDHKDKYGYEFYNDAAFFDAATPVVVTLGQVTENVNAVLGRGGKISGRVLAEDSGRPLDNVDIDLYDSHGRYLGDWGSFGDYTSGNGDYELGGLRPGSYVVKFADKTYHIEQATGVCGDAIRYNGLFYNQAPDIETANPVTVQAGQTTKNIHAVLPRQTQPESGTIDFYLPLVGK